MVNWMLTYVLSTAHGQFRINKYCHKSINILKLFAYAKPDPSQMDKLSVNTEEHKKTTGGQKG